jgi:hypothetical protein
MFSSDSTQVSSAVNYIEDVFSTYLYTGNSSTQTITNGIDLSTKGGLVWLKARSQAYNNLLNDSATGPDLFLSSNTTGALSSVTALSSFTTSGFVLPSYVLSNQTGTTYASWTFRKQPKFFDVVTFTSDAAGNTNQRILHNLQTTPGCIIVKNINSVQNWNVYHFRANVGTAFPKQDVYLNLNTTGSIQNGTNFWGTSAPTDTDFGINTNIWTPNKQYVAYLFSNQDGGFGLTGTDNVITCSSFTTDASYNATVDLGYEPQYVLVKSTASATARNGFNDWRVIDVMRGFDNSNFNSLSPNLSSAEAAYSGGFFVPTATGFNVSGYFGYSNTYIYIAIRRGPMKVPTDATKVFEPALYTGNGATSRTFTSSTVSPIDAVITMKRGSGGNIWTVDRLRGNGVIRTQYTDAEDTGSSALSFAYQNGYSNNFNPAAFGWNGSGNLDENYFFRRAPSFFDEVCYTGTGATTSYTHNLTVAPELIIIKDRTTAGTEWFVGTNFGASTFSQLYLSNTSAESSFSYGTYISSQPTSSVFRITSNAIINGSGDNYVAYLFATCIGVSKVGSYTGTGALQTVNCGFTSGARFVLIKRTDSTGDWWTYDSARGITSGNDPYLFLNSTAAEVTTTNYVDTDSTGFKVTAAAPAGLNASGGTYIFLAIA